MSLYEEIGGQPAVEAAVNRFYERVTVDPILEHFFKNMDIRQLKVHQIAFLTQAMGGPERYNGAAMDRAHAHLRIEQRHFDAVAGHLVGTLQDLSVPEHLIAAVVERIAPLAPQVVNTPSSDAAQA
jgi:hemoglobin